MHWVNKEVRNIALYLLFKFKSKTCKAELLYEQLSCGIKSSWGQISNVYTSMQSYMDTKSLLWHKSNKYIKTNGA